MKREIAGSKMLITGASRGIGRALAVFFAEKGAEIVVTGRNAAGLGGTCALIGPRCHGCVADLRDYPSLERLADFVRQQMGGLDFLINNAADVTSKPLLETSPEEIDGLIRTNVTGVLQLCRLLLPMMLEHDGGTIINISSLAGYKANPTQTVYSISKSAVNAVSEALRAELRNRQIHVMNVALASVAVTEPPKPGQVPVDVFAARLLQAIERGEKEVFLSPVTKWLMRLYQFYPPLKEMR